MKQNPCRYCALATMRNGKHYSSFRDECIYCDNNKKHREYLKSKRKFVPGEPITTLSELLEQEWVMWYHNTKHIEMFKSMPIRTVLRFLEIGAFRKAVRKERED